MSRDHKQDLTKEKEGRMENRILMKRLRKKKMLRRMRLQRVAKEKNKIQKRNRKTRARN